MDLQTAASRLGVHYQTAYRWVRDGSLPAVKRGTSYHIAEDDLESFRVRRESPAPPRQRTTVRSWDRHVDRLFDRLVVGDELGARAVVDRLQVGGVPALEMCDELLAPALRRVGSRWAAGRLSVAEEHRCSAICERLLARIADHPRGRPRGICVVATATGEEHALPASMAAVALRSDRWQVHHLGAQVPADDLVDLARALDADMVVLSTTTPAARGVSEEVAGSVARSTRADVLVGAPGDRLHDLVVRARALRRSAPGAHS